MEKLILVHLSDIHFSKASGSFHDLDGDIRNELMRDLRSVTRVIGSATGVLVTGDIAFSGKKEEFKHAADWLCDLCRNIDCPEENVWVVPGNHDVDRNLAKSKITQTLQESIRSKSESSIDTELRAVLSDKQSGEAVFAPLAEYNNFAARFQCSISPEKPFWEKDLKLSCGTRIRLRGLCSVVVSNHSDEKGNMVLGLAQASVPRIEGVEYLTLCHHPPDWLRDQDSIINHLESKVRIQLFGHKHSQRVQTINKTLRLTAGAMHPDRRESGWLPVYNIIEITRRDDETLCARLFQRRWHQTECRFVAEGDTNRGVDHYEFLWQDCPRPIVDPTLDVGKKSMHMTSSEREIIKKVTTKPMEESEAMQSPNPERRLTFRFLGLPFRHQFTIAQQLNLLTDDDEALSNEALFRVLFERAAAKGLLAKLWEETERFHPDAADSNPFD